MNVWLHQAALRLGFVSLVFGGVILGFADFFVGGLKKAQASG